MVAMDSFEINKFIGALLATVLVLLVLNNLSGLLFDAGHPQKPGYVIEVAEAATNHADDADAKTDDSPSALTLIGSADASQYVARLSQITQSRVGPAAAGNQLRDACIGCHPGAIDAHVENSC